mmetsp:Transcript_13096/g.36980  ORF Transcript_13096/g.36980 Transcript_13096/m.36980 type:complete len:281 (+) Transcript_13096:776-1618(+)
MQADCQHQRWVLPARDDQLLRFLEQLRQGCSKGLVRWPALHPTSGRGLVQRLAMRMLCRCHWLALLDLWRRDLQVRRQGLVQRLALLCQGRVRGQPLLHAWRGLVLRPARRVLCRVDGLALLDLPLPLVLLWRCQSVVWLALLRVRHQRPARQRLALRCAPRRGLARRRAFGRAVWSGGLVHRTFLERVWRRPRWRPGARALDLARQDALLGPRRRVPQGGGELADQGAVMARAVPPEASTSEDKADRDEKSRWSPCRHGRGAVLAVSQARARARPQPEA